MKKNISLIVLLFVISATLWGEVITFDRLESKLLSIEETDILAMYSKSEDSVEDVRLLSEQMLPYNQLFHGIVNQPLWVKFQIHFEEPGEYILALNNHKIEFFDLYIYNEEGEFLQEKHISKNIPFFEREIPGLVPGNIFFVDESNLQLTFYARLDTHSSMKAYMTVYTTTSYLLSMITSEWFYIFYSGSFFILMFYNLIVFFSTRDRNYLYYSFYLFFSMMYMISVEGFGDAFLWPGCKWLYPRSYNLSIAFLFFVGLLFTSRFLNTKENLPRIHQIIRIMSVITLILGACFFFIVDNWLVNIGTAAILFNLVLFIVSGVLSMKMKQEPAGYFTLAWSFMFTGCLITTCKRLGVLPYNYFTENAIYMGQYIEVLLLARALGSRINFYQQKAIVTEKALTRAQYNILQNRMSPHFIFNTLTLIFSELENNVERAQLSLTRLADNYRYLTDLNQRKLVKAGDEKKFTENYLMLMKSRYGDDLRFELIWDDRLNSLPIPPFFLQPLVENSFKHGLWSTKKKWIKIIGQFDGKHVSLKVLNHGIIPPKRVIQSETFNNIRTRLSLYYHHVTLYLDPEPNGAIAVLSFSLIREN